MAGLWFCRRRDRPRRVSSIAHELWPREMRTAQHVEKYADPDMRRQALVSIIDQSGFSIKVFMVAASGFFVDSYNLFACNVILPSLAFVYLGEHSQSTEITINALTLAGSAVGQVIFGLLGDMFGRQRLYGIELVIVIFTTLGLAASGPGVGGSSMSVTAWLMFWRFVMVTGIGAEYPLSACITTEWASKQSRAQMMSAVFLMQPLGQFCAYSVGLAVLHGLSGQFDMTKDNLDARIGIDILWRVVAGVGGIPALIVLIFRWIIPESGRYTCDIKRDSWKALVDTNDGTTGLFSHWHSTEDVTQGEQEQYQHGDVETGVAHGGDHADVEKDCSEHRDFAESQQTSHDGGGPKAPHPGPQTDYPISQAPQTVGNGSLAAEQAVTSPNIPAMDNARSTMETPGPAMAPKADTAVTGESRSKAMAHGAVAGLDDDIKTWNQFSREERRSYFYDGSNWRYLFGASACWFFLDFVFYGLGFNNPGTLAKLWTAHNADYDQGSTPTWLLNSAALNRDGSIQAALNSNGVESLVTVSVWSLIGCAVMTNRINFIDRRFTVIWTSILLSILLLVTAIVFPHCFHEPGHPVLIVMYVVIQFFFSYGPNTLLFIIPAEIFPTKYRCSCYGICAASGKLGAVAMQLVYMYFDHRRLKDPNSPDLGYLMYIFAVFMLIVAIITWLYIPKVQERSSGKERRSICIPSNTVVPNRSLEELGEGRESVNEEDRVGSKDRLGALLSRLRARWQR